MKLLTKSNYLIGLQCLKHLWIEKNEPEKVPELDDVLKAKFKEGKIIGEFAKKLFPEGIDLSEEDFKENIEKTKSLLKKRLPLFEAGFKTDNLYSRADILLPVGKDKWDIIEVKSATKVKDLNIHDVSFQKHVYEKGGLKIRNCFIMHVNNEYVKKGEIEPSEFFVKTDITEKIKEFSKDIEARIERMFQVIKGKCPEFHVDDLKTIEYENFVKDEFLDSLPEENIFDFYRMRTSQKIELYQEGIIKIHEVPDSVKLNDKQKIQRILAEKGGKHIDKKQITFFLKELKYPIYYLDFETINPAIPIFDGMKPYQRIPFQFSLHIQEKIKGKLKRIGFLAEGTDDSRPKFLQALKENLGEKGSILVYNQSFEKGVLRESIDFFPEFEAWLKNINLRMKDLWDIFRNFWYYDPKQKGSASIKEVLPVISDLKYDDLEIKKGDSASYEWERITFKENVSEEEKQRIRKALEEYCKLDTLAEVEILEKLRGIC